MADRPVKLVSHSNDRLKQRFAACLPCGKSRSIRENGIALFNCDAYPFGFKRRLASMTIAWLFMGMLVGAFNWLQLGGGFSGFVSQIIAGMLVLSLLGIALTLLGGRAKESLSGGAFGMVAGGVVGLFISSSFSLWEMMNLSMLMGAIVGATIVPWIRVMTKAVLLLANVRVRPVHE